MHPALCRLILPLVLALAVLLLTGMGPRPVGPADVASISHISITDNEVLTKNKPIEVVFTSPMVRAEEVDRKVNIKDMPFTITPPVSGKGRWLTDTTFSFTAEKGYPRGRQYFLVFKDDLRAVDGKPVRFLLGFRTAATEVREAVPGFYNAEKRELSLDLTFTLPVTVPALERHLTVKDAQSGEVLPYTVRKDKRENARRVITVALGSHRPAIDLAISADADDEEAPLGFAGPWTVSVRIPGAEETGKPFLFSGKDGDASPQHFRDPYARENRSVQELVFPLAYEAAQQDIKDFVRVTPDLPVTLSGGGNALVIREGVRPGMTVSVTLKPGLPDAGGRVLKEERTASLVVPDLEAGVYFADGGNYLTPVHGSRLALDLVNVARVDVRLQRQYDNNLPLVGLETYNQDMARNIYRETFPVTAEKNQILRRGIDLEALAKGQRGVFILRITGHELRKSSDGSTWYGYGDSDERVVVLSDIGVTARRFPSGITVYASSLATGAPLPGARVAVYSNNQILAQGKTGRDGVFTHQREEPWDPQLTPSVITVATDSDGTFLPFRDNLRAQLTDTAEREYLDKGYEAFVYTPRGVFRPGETVDIKTFVRDAAHKAPAPFPVLFKVVSSRNLEVSRGTATLTQEGGAYFSFALPVSAPTGEYTATVSIPGQDKGLLGSMTFSVEDFVPPRLEVDVSPGRDALVAGDALPVSLAARYLFGAPGSNLEYELGYRASAKAFTPPGYEGWFFGDAEQTFDPEINLKYLKGALTKEGAAVLSFKPPAGWKPPALLNLMLIAGVREDGGRWVTRTETVTWFPGPALLGLKAEEEPAPGKPASVRVAAVNAKGEAVDCGPLSVEISLVQGNWHTVERGGRWVHSWTERLLPLEKLKVDTKDGQGVLAFTPGEPGVYLVRCADARGTLVAARRFAAWGAEGPTGGDGGGRMTVVELALDKKEYRAGETARLSIKAPYAGTLFLGVERGGQLTARTMPMPEPAMTVEVPVTADMDPNATVTAWVYRPLSGESKEWYPHRAYGSIPLLLSRAKHTLTVKAEAPERATPSKPLSIPFTVTDKNGGPVAGEFSVALVDEGVLSLTAFATPDPAAFFMARRRAVGVSYDIFDRLLRPELKPLTLLAPGGDAAANYQGSLSTQRVYLTAFAPLVRTDASGKGEATFDLPEYSGKGRLMIVGASKDRFASQAVPVPVSRDLVVESSAPRAVAPGDVFDVSVKAFALQGGLDGTATIRVTADGPLVLSGDVSANIPLGKAADGNAKGLTVRAEARQASGIAQITIAASVPGRPDLSFAQTLEVAVRPPYPRTSVSTSAVIKAGETATLALPGAWLKGGVSPALSVGPSPVYSALPALEYLRGYPYGCLEQLTSRAWPYLTLGAVQKALNPDADPEAQAKATLADIVGRIISLQQTDGSFVMWPGMTQSDPWKSVNAALFLAEAKATVPIPGNALARSLSYMRTLLARPENAFETPSLAYTTKAYAAFVLTRAGEAPLSWLSHLTGQERLMLPSGRIFLAAAKALHAGNPDALKALDDKALLLDDLKLGYNPSMETELRNRSLLLLAWSLVAPADPATRSLCADVARRLSDSRFLTTQDAGTAALALGTWLNKAGTFSRDFTATVSSSGAPLAETQKGAPLVLGRDRLLLTPEGGPAPLDIAVSGKGEAWAVYSASGIPLEAPAPGSSGLVLQRVWKNAGGQVLDLSGGPVTLKKGERVFVELTIAPGRPVADLALSDLLPGGLEVENPRLNTAGAAQNTDAGADGENGNENNDTMPEGPAAPDVHMDLREDRLLLFFNRLAKPVTYRYSMRAITAGTYALPPLAAEGMYAPEINAVTAGGTVVVE